eukprot:1370199-Amorphochlora_amoeboformis.AAC.2
MENLLGYEQHLGDCRVGLERTVSSFVRVGFDKGLEDFSDLALLHAQTRELIHRHKPSRGKSMGRGKASKKK